MQPGQAPPRPLRQGGRRGGPLAPVRLRPLRDDDTRLSRADSAASMPKSVVVSPFFDWGNDRPPEIPWHQTVIYELHVKGFTAQPPRRPRRAAGHLRRAGDPRGGRRTSVSLGVTAVELQPVHQFVHDHALVERGLRNYWGYNSICYLAPHNGYAASGSLGQQVQEFKQLVKTMHAAGHRGDPRRGLQPHRRGQPPRADAVAQGASTTPPTTGCSTEDPRYYVDYTGTGNTLNVRHPHVLQLLMDSLRYWVLEMHVDGFRFDLAATLARHPPRGGPALGLLRPDPAGPGDQPGEADRRAVGRRRGRLPGRELPARCGRSGTAATGTACATTGGARSRPSPSSPTA